MTFILPAPVGTLLRPPVFDYLNDQRITTVNSLKRPHIPDIHCSDEIKKQRLSESPELPPVRKLSQVSHQPPHQVPHLKKEISPDTRFRPFNNGSPDAFRSPPAEQEAVVPRVGLDSAEEDAEEILVRMRHCSEWYTAQAAQAAAAAAAAHAHNKPLSASAPPPSRHFDVFIDHSPPFFSPEFAPGYPPMDFFPPGHSHNAGPHLSHSLNHNHHSHNHNLHSSGPHHNLNVNHIHNLNHNPHPLSHTHPISGSNSPNIASPKGSLRHILDGQMGVPILPPPPAFFDHAQQHKRKMYEDEFRFETDEDFFRKANKKKSKKECRTKFAGEEAVIQREINSGGLCFKTHKPKIQREYYYSKLSKTIFRWTCCGSQAKTHPDS